MLCRAGYPYHFEFTYHHGQSVGRAPTKDNLLIFYIPEEEQWQQTVNRLIANGFDPAESYNPYWDLTGKTFEDPDGYRVVIQHSAWTP